MARSGPELEELERDALTELVNVGVGRAAASLRDMVGHEVLLSVPAIEVLDYHEASAFLGQRENHSLLAVQQNFSGQLNGRAMLIFPQPNGLDLVRAVLGDDVDLETALEMENEALSETGNVILNSCLGTIANMLRQSLEIGIPEVLRGSASDLLVPEATETGDGLMLFIYINFSVRERDLRGYIALLMGLRSITVLRTLLGQFIASVMDDGESLALV